MDEMSLALQLALIRKSFLGGNPLPAHQGRIEKLKKFLAFLDKNIPSVFSIVSAFDKQLLASGETRGDTSFGPSRAQPSGVCFAVIQQAPHMRIFLELGLKHILAGNYFICELVGAPLPVRSALLELIHSMITEKILEPNEWTLLVDLQIQSRQFLMHHPAVASVEFFQGQSEDDLGFSSDLFAAKKVVLHRPGVLTSFIDGEPPHSQVEKSLKQLLSGAHAWVNTPKRFFVLEAHFQSWLSYFSQILEGPHSFGAAGSLAGGAAGDVFGAHSKGVAIAGAESTNPGFFQELIQRVEAEEGRIVGNATVHSGGSRILLVRDLPQCSDLHQRYSDLPIVLLSSVKYRSDLQKWVNNSGACYGVQLLGDSEKMNKLSLSLRAPQVWINQGTEVGLCKWGGSFCSRGNLDLHPMGSFYSDISYTEISP